MGWKLCFGCILHLIALVVWAGCVWGAQSTGVFHPVSHQVLSFVGVTVASLNDYFCPVQSSTRSLALALRSSTTSNRSKETVHLDYNRCRLHLAWTRPSGYVRPLSHLHNLGSPLIFIVLASRCTQVSCLP